MAAQSFHFEAATHEYFLDGKRIPSITQLLEMGGLVNGLEYFTEESRQRGTEVHKLCADWDMNALDPLTVVSNRRPYLLGYIAVRTALKATDLAVEEADYHPALRFAGRTDRVWELFGALTVAELKSAAKARHHAIQTALQAILASVRWKLPPEQWQRICVYLKHTGKFSVEKHEDPRDFATAFSLIKRFC